MKQCESSFAPHSYTESVLRGHKTNNKETGFEGREKRKTERCEEYSVFYAFIFETILLLAIWMVAGY
jgi:hypothetical protein